MAGRAKRVVFNLVPLSGPGVASFEIDLDFRGGIQAMRIVCNFPTPCTTNVPLLREPLPALLTRGTSAR